MGLELKYNLGLNPEVQWIGGGSVSGMEVVCSPDRLGEGGSGVKRGLGPGRWTREIDASGIRSNGRDSD